MTGRPSIEIADLFERYEDLLGPLLPEQHKVIRAIKNCRTGALGGHRLECNTCEYEKNAYNSCRNRHCPKCGFTAKTRWIENRVDELLDCPYFHVVFTLPSELRPLMLRNKKICYDILFKSASETIKEIAKDPKHLGAEVGCIGVLHTWAQNLVDHPHIHFIVPGGGLNKEGHWVSSSEGFLLPVQVLSKVFRGKFLEKLELANDKSKLKFMGQIEHLSHPGLFKDLLFKCSTKEFVVYAKKPFGGPEAVLKYLGNYTHRIAISNYRLVKLENETVYFKVRDQKNPGTSKVMSLHVGEFMRRFLLHVLPKAFVRIRHFGLLGNRSKKEKIALIRRLQGIKENAIKETAESWQKLLERVKGIVADQCPCCKVGILSAATLFMPRLNTA